MTPSSIGLFVASIGIVLLQSQAQIMSVDLGHEFFKVALMRQGVPLEIVLNGHSKRKTSTAVSFHEAVRIFGDDALAHQGKAPTKVPMFFHSLLGQNFTAEDVKPGGKWWEKFGLGDKFYSYNLGYEEVRGVPTFFVGKEGEESAGEEVLANIFFIARQLSQDTAEGKPVRDLVVTVPCDASLRQRQAIVAAGEIAGLRILTLVHENAAFAVQRAIDFMPEKGEELVLFYNLGSRKAEVSIVKFGSRSAGMVAGKVAPVVTVLGSAVDYSIGGHLMDIRIAEAMLAKFQEKNPKLASGILQNPRALRKLLSQAQKTKAMLSSNKAAPFTVESLYEDKDFQANIKREDFEAMCKDMFDRLTDPIERALKMANATMADIAHVEVVGGAWRVPKVQQLLQEVVEKGSGKKLPLGQHLNGEEAAALGAALVAANSSQSFRVKKMFFSDVTMHEYAAQITSLTGEWEKNLTILYPVGTMLGKKKTVTTSLEEDFKIKLFEDGVLISEHEITGVADLFQGKWKELNLTGPPKIAASIPLEMSGIVEIKLPTITVEESYWVNISKEKPKANKTNSSNDTNGSKEAEPEKKKDEESSEDKEEEEGKEKDEPKDGEIDKDEEQKAPVDQKDAATADTNTSENGTQVEEKEYEIIQKLKKRKHEKQLKVRRIDYKPVPLSDDRIAELRKKLELIAKQESEVQAVAGMKNELEASIYGAREKTERDDIRQVSTEEQREALTKLCGQHQEWMLEDGATGTKADYEQRLKGIEDLLGPIEERAMELEARSDLPVAVKEAVMDITKSIKFIHANMSWVNVSKTDAIEKKMAEFSEWWAKKEEQQSELPLHEAPAFTRNEVIEKLGKIQKDLDKLKKIKQPKEKVEKPVKVEKPEKTDKAKSKAGKDSKAKEEKAKAPEPELSSDTAVVEKDLAELRDKKAAAVENEDFDLAQNLKVKEQVLVKHLEKLNSEKSEL